MLKKVLIISLLIAAPAAMAMEKKEQKSQNFATHEAEFEAMKECLRKNTKSEQQIDCLRNLNLSSDFNKSMREATIIQKLGLKKEIEERKQRCIKDKPC